MKNIYLFFVSRKSKKRVRSEAGLPEEFYYLPYSSEIQVLDPESIIGPLFGLLFDPKYRPNSGSFSNSKVGSSYSPKFDLMSLEKWKNSLMICINCSVDEWLVGQGHRTLKIQWGSE